MRKRHTTQHTHPKGADAGAAGRGLGAGAVGLGCTRLRQEDVARLDIEVHKALAVHAVEALGLWHLEHCAVTVMLACIPSGAVSPAALLP